MKYKVAIIQLIYPSVNNLYALSYVHSRNVLYPYEVDVFIYNKTKSYIFEGILVRNISLFNPKEYNLVIFHSPNIIRSFLNLLNCVHVKKLFVFHGHEVSIRLFDYRDVNNFVSLNNVKNLFLFPYDIFKLITLKFYLKLFKVDLIFISQIVKNRFDRIIKLNFNYKIIPNDVNTIFKLNNYKPRKRLRKKIVSIRQFEKYFYCFNDIIELSKYCINFDFYLFGSFSRKQVIKANSCFNVFINFNFIKQNELPELYNQFDATIYLSTTDTQGVSAFESSTYGIKTIVYDTEASKIFLTDFQNTLILSQNKSFAHNSKLIQQFIENSNNDFIKKPDYNFIKEEIKFLDEILK